ncbi:MAG: hypothetical protein RMX65_013700 [Nostoc sp. DedQUE01]|nr:hypothetical protein [Nostoc sp. DedQUE01]
MNLLLCAFARQSLQRGATALDGFPGLKQVACEPPQRAALPLREIKNHLCKRSIDYLVAKRSPF